MTAEESDGAKHYSECPEKRRFVVCDPVNSEACIKARGYLLDTPWVNVSKVGTLWGRYVAACLLERARESS